MRRQSGMCKGKRRYKIRQEAILDRSILEDRRGIKWLKGKQNNEGIYVERHAAICPLAPKPHRKLPIFFNFFFNLENEVPKNKIMFMKSSVRHAVLGEQLMV
jgi:hypothetical protein